MAGKFKVRPIAGHEPVPRFIDPDDSNRAVGTVGPLDLWVQKFKKGVIY